MSYLIFIVTAALLIAVTNYLRYKRRMNQIEAVFAGRIPLEPLEFYLRYFKGKGIPFYVVDGICSILEEHLSADLSRLREDDDFSKNLSFFWDFDSMADREIVCALENKFGIKISEEEAEKTHTVADIMDLVNSKLEEQNSPK
ncbi:MAG: hypothetical protein PHH11_11655 [Methylomonas sp.]|nr:hypothetical protein [Methylomonas sp.]